MLANLTQEKVKVMEWNGSDVPFCIPDGGMVMIRWLSCCSLRGLVVDAGVNAQHDGLRLYRDSISRSSRWTMKIIDGRCNKYLLSNGCVKASSRKRWALKREREEEGIGGEGGSTAPQNRVRYYPGPMNQTCLNNTDWALEKNWKIKKKLRKQVSGQKQEQRNEKNRCRNWYRVSWSNQSLTRSRVSPRLYPRISVMVRPIVLRITVDARQKHSYLVCFRTKSRWRVYQKKFYLSGSWGRRSVRLILQTGVTAQYADHI